MRRPILVTVATTAAVAALLGAKAATGTGQVRLPLAGARSSVSGSTPTGGPTSGASPLTTDGPVVSTPYGPVQVEITTLGAKITDARALQQPGGNGLSDQINAYAVPQLNREAIDASSADINMVSGASYTSIGYAQSLQAALDQAAP